MDGVKLNFGNIKNVYNTILAEGISSKDTKKKGVFKKYIATLKENKILKDLFMVHTNIESKIEENEFKATEFVKANIALLDKYSKKEIKEAILNLSSNIIFESVDVLDYKGSKLEELHENINKLILMPNTAKNIDTIVECRAKIVDYIKENKVKEVVSNNSVFPNSILSNIVVDRYNETYSNLSEDEKKVVKTILESDEETKIDLYKTLSRECVDLIDKQLSESDIDTKEKLLAVKDRILRVEYSSDSFISEVSKLLELKNDLSE